MTESADQLWQRYKAKHHPEIKKQLMARYIGLVKYVAQRLNLAQTPLLEEDDLVNIGMLGLHDAIDRFDPERGIKFETYAIPRIKGMIIDEIRKLDLVPRSVREKSRLVKEAVHRLEGEKKREVSAAEIASELSLSVEEYQRLKANAISIVSLDKTLDDDEVHSLYDVTLASDAPDIAEAIDKQNMREVLMEAINQLPDKERLVIALYYYEELTFKEIGALLGISESRVSQIHGEVLLKLRRCLHNFVEDQNATGGLS